MHSQSHVVRGLGSPASIVVDGWGVPHIRAASRRDAFFVQGFNAARDRLWQIDLWRKRGLGLLAADFGPGYLEQDRACRLFLYRGDMTAEWGAYGTADARETVEAFTAGINAYIDETVRDPALLPPEFLAVGTTPARWQAEDVPRIRSHALSDNALSEVARARVMASANADTDLLRQGLDPPLVPTIPDGLDLAAIPPDVLAVFTLATAPVTFEAERLSAKLEDASLWSRVVEGRVARTEGSNNWALAPGRTATGRPILASDPHRALQLPSLRYVAHLEAPGLNVIGAGEPALPGIAIGHNGTAAFGLTIFPTDQEDVYVYDTHPEDAHRYRYGSGFETMRVVREPIAVKGAAGQTALLKFTRHGPVVFEDRARRKAYAIRSVWQEPGSAAYLGSLAYLGVTSRDAFEGALVHWSVPPVNQVYADTSGAIGWCAAAKAPKRPNWDGLLPVPGDGRYEWAGFHAGADLPRLRDPAEGFVATANEMNLPAGFPIERVALGREWLDPSRARRIRAVLGETGAMTLERSLALQLDTLSLPAQRICALLQAGQSRDTAFRRALEILSDWDHLLERTSPAAALFEVWWQCHLIPAVLAAAARSPEIAALLAPGDVGSVAGWLERRGAEAGPLLGSTLAAAYGDCAARMGVDAAAWHWGRLHHVHFPHPLAHLREKWAPVRVNSRRDEVQAPRPTPPIGDIGPLPVGGSGSTVMNMSYRPADFRATTGASFRMVVDVGAWDNSRFVNAPGQSGDMRSPHYGYHARPWAAGESFPLLYSREAVDAAAERVITLEPAPAWSHRDGAS